MRYLFRIYACQNETMKTLSPHGATIVDEAVAVAIINFCLFGDTAKPLRTTLAALRTRARRAMHPPPQQVTEIANIQLLDEVMLRKPTTPQDSQVTPTPTKPVKNTPYLWQPRRGLSFPRGLCYLTAVQEHNWPHATVELGYYPTVQALLCSPYVEKFSGYLVEQEPGLYHMKGRFVRGAITLFSARSKWRVGAHLPGRPHPGHNAGYPQ